MPDHDEDIQLEDAEVTEEEVEESKSPFAVFFELENVAIHSRQATYDVLSSILTEQKIPFQPIHFGRYCLNPSLEEYVPDLLEAIGAKKLSADKLADDISSGYKMFLTSQEATLDPNGYCWSHGYKVKPNHNSCN